MEDSSTDGDTVDISTLTPTPAGGPAIGTPMSAPTQQVRIGRQTSAGTTGGPITTRRVKGGPDDAPPDDAPPSDDE